MVTARDQGLGIGWPDALPAELVDRFPVLGGRNKFQNVIHLVIPVRDLCVTR